MSRRRAIVLFSGGLDSMLAVRLLQTQAIDVVAVYLQTIFMTGSAQAERAACQLKVPLTTIVAGDDYLSIVRAPKFGYGQGANPCLDCRIFALRQAVNLMGELKADFLATGEVVGQRLMGQKRRDLDVVAYHSGCEDLLVRPLCAKRLPPSRPEREGWVDRQQFFDFCGTGRRRQMALARRLGIEPIPPQTPGCMLVEKHYADKVHRLIQLGDGGRSWDFQLLSIGRHFQVGDNTTIVVGRNAQDNAQLDEAFSRNDGHDAALLTPQGFNGPTVLIVGASTAHIEHQAKEYLLRFTHDPRASLERISVVRLDCLPRVAKTAQSKITAASVAELS